MAEMNGFLFRCSLPTGNVNAPLGGRDLPMIARTRTEAEARECVTRSLSHAWDITLIDQGPHILAQAIEAGVKEGNCAPYER